MDTVTFDHKWYHIVQGWDGTVKFYNTLHHLHRLDGPAVLQPNGTVQWRQFGHLHRLDGPAYVNTVTGNQHWFLQGVEYTQPDHAHQVEQLALIDELTHVVERGMSGTTYRNSAGDIHRTNGPAFESPDGSRTWFQNGLMHRIEGPAIENRRTGAFMYYFHGVLYMTPQQFKTKLKQEGLINE